MIRALPHSCGQLFRPRPIPLCGRPVLRTQSSDKYCTWPILRPAVRCFCRAVSTTLAVVDHLLQEFLAGLLIAATNRWMQRVYCSIRSLADGSPLCPIYSLNRRTHKNGFKWNRTLPDSNSQSTRAGDTKKRVPSLLFCW